MFPGYMFNRRATILQASYFTLPNVGEGLTGGKLMLGAILRRVHVSILLTDYHSMRSIT